MVTALQHRYFSLLQPSGSLDDLDPEEMCIQLKGVARFLAAVAVAKPIPGYKTHPELNPAFLWSLLASICNEEMIPELASEVLVNRF